MKLCTVKVHFPSNKAAIDDRAVRIMDKRRGRIIEAALFNSVAGFDRNL